MNEKEQEKSEYPLVYVCAVMMNKCGVGTSPFTLLKCCSNSRRLTYLLSYWQVVMSETHRPGKEVAFSSTYKRVRGGETVRQHRQFQGDKLIATASKWLTPKAKLGTKSTQKRNTSHMCAQRMKAWRGSFAKLCGAFMNSAWSSSLLTQWSATCTQFESSMPTGSRMHILTLSKYVVLMSLSYIWL